MGAGWGVGANDLSCLHVGFLLSKHTVAHGLWAAGSFRPALSCLRLCDWCQVEHHVKAQANLWRSLCAPPYLSFPEK